MPVLLEKYSWAYGWPVAKKTNPSYCSAKRVLMYIKEYCRSAVRINLGGLFIITKNDYEFEESQIETSFFVCQNRQLADKQTLAVVGFLHAIEAVKGERLLAAIINYHTEKRSSQYKTDKFDSIYVFDLRKFIGSFMREKYPEIETYWEYCENCALPLLLDLPTSRSNLQQLRQYLLDALSDSKLLDTEGVAVFPYAPSTQIYNPDTMQSLPGDHPAWECSECTEPGHFWAEQQKVVARLVTDLGVNKSAFLAMSWGVGGQPWEAFQWLARFRQAGVEIQLDCYEKEAYWLSSCRQMERLVAGSYEEMSCGGWPELVSMLREIREALYYGSVDLSSLRIGEGQVLPLLPAVRRMVDFREGDLLGIRSLAAAAPSKYNLVAILKTLYFCGNDYETRDAVFYYACRLLARPHGILFFQDWDSSQSDWANQRLPLLLSELSARDITREVLGQTDDSDELLRVIQVL